MKWMFQSCTIFSAGGAGHTETKRAAKGITRLLTGDTGSATLGLMRLVLNIESRQLNTTLDQLRPGQRAEIVRIDGVDGIASRLREMGFVPGEPVEYLRCAPFGGPVKCSIHGSRIAVRCGEARRVLVQPLG